MSFWPQACTLLEDSKLNLRNILRKLYTLTLRSQKDGLILMLCISYYQNGVALTCYATM